MLLDHAQSTLMCPTCCKLSATCKDNPPALEHYFSQSHRAPRSRLQHLNWQQKPWPVSEHTPSSAQYETGQGITCAGALVVPWVHKPEKALGSVTRMHRLTLGFSPRRTFLLLSEKSKRMILSTIFFVLFFLKLFAIFKCTVCVNSI